MGYMIVKEDRIIIKPHKGTGIEVMGVLYFIHLNLEKVKEWCFGTTHTLIVGKECMKL